MKTLQIQIDCGETTCAREPGKFCEFFGTRRFGTTPVCMLFPQADPNPHNQGASTDLKGKDGWIQRCSACMEAEVK